MQIARWLGILHGGADGEMIAGQNILAQASYRPIQGTTAHGPTLGSPTNTLDYGLSRPQAEELGQTKVSH